MAFLEQHLKSLPIYQFLYELCDNTNSDQLSITDLHSNLTSVQYGSHDTLLAASPVHRSRVYKDRRIW